MGSRVSDKDEITILVTGFGPFREQYPVNPSWEIARRLPAYLPPLRAKDPNSRMAAAAAVAGGGLPEVRIRVHPEPIHVGYRAVRELVPKLLDGGLVEGGVPGDDIGWKGPPDVVVHIGMAGPRPCYQIERRGHRQGYESADVDGEMLEDEREGGHGEDWVWYGYPEELETELDMEDILTRWQGYSLKDMDLRISEDAGRYLCDFIYYCSLSHLWKQGRPRKVVFLHVPSDATEEAVQRGTELVVNLVRAIAESEVTKLVRRGN